MWFVEKGWKHLDLNFAEQQVFERRIAGIYDLILEFIDSVWAIQRVL